MADDLAQIWLMTEVETIETIDVRRGGRSSTISAVGFPPHAQQNK